MTKSNNGRGSDDQRSSDPRSSNPRLTWDRAAASFDDEPDHGLRDPAVRQAWTDLLRAALPSPPIAVLDIGCGTGSLSVVLAGLGYHVTGIDASPAMIRLAEEKAVQAGFTIPFHIMDAIDPTVPPHSFDVILCRHLLWALPEPKAVLARWANLLRPGGRLVLIEGFWHTGAGLHAEDIEKLLPESIQQVSLQNLSDQPALWGRPVEDERYLLIARLL